MKDTAARIKPSGKAAPEVIKEDDPPPGAQERLDFIATAAYYKAKSRGFVPGLEMDDWLDAEAEFEEKEAAL